MLLAPAVTMKFNGGPAGAGEEKWSIHTFMINFISHPLECLGKPAHLTPSCEVYIAYFTSTVALAKIEI